MDVIVSKICVLLFEIYVQGSVRIIRSIYSSMIITRYQCFSKQKLFSAYENQTIQHWDFISKQRSNSCRLIHFLFKHESKVMKLLLFFQLISCEIRMLKSGLVRLLQHVTTQTTQKLFLLGGLKSLCYPTQTHPLYGRDMCLRHIYSILALWLD